VQLSSVAFGGVLAIMPDGGLHEKLSSGFPRKHTHEAAQRVIRVLIDRNVFAIAMGRPSARPTAPRSI